MVNARLRYNGLRTTLGAGLTNAATAVSFAGPLQHSGGTNVPTLAGGDYIMLAIIDPASGQLRELVKLTAYVAGASTGTIARAQEGTVGVAHASGSLVVHVPTASDFATTTPVVFRGHVPPNTAVATLTTVNWTEDTDTHNAHAAGTFTVPAGQAGKYLICAGWKPNAAVAVGMNVRKNGANILTSPASGAAAFSGLSVTYLADLAVGDAITAQFTANFTTTNDLVGDNTWFHIVRLGA